MADDLVQGVLHVVIAFPGRRKARYAGSPVGIRSSKQFHEQRLAVLVKKGGDQPAVVFLFNRPAAAVPRHRHVIERKRVVKDAAVQIVVV